MYGGVGRNATGNTIVVKGGDLSNADLFGYSDGRRSHADNSLEIWASDVKIRSVQNFENYYFFVPDDVVNQADKYMLRVGTPVYLSGTNVGMAVQNGVVLNIGDTINLIDKTEGTPDKVMLGGKEFKGGTLFTDYDFVLELSGNSLVAIADRKALGGGRLPAGKAKPETKSLVEGQVASVALLSEGNELATGQALTDAKTAASAAAAEGKNWAVFATLGGGKVVRPFLGLAWDREFNGEANAKVNGYRIDAPTLNGSTGLLELGISCRPGSKSNWQLDFAATGYIGVRKGLRGSAHFVCNF